MDWWRHFTSELCQFCLPHFASIFRRRNQKLSIPSIWRLCQGSKRSHTGGKSVTCRGLHNSEINQSCMISHGLEWAVWCGCCVHFFSYSCIVTQIIKCLSSAFFITKVRGCRECLVEYRLSWAIHFNIC